MESLWAGVEDVGGIGHHLVRLSLWRNKLSELLFLYIVQQRLLVSDLVGVGLVFVQGLALFVLLQLLVLLGSGVWELLVDEGVVLFLMAS